MPTYEYACTSCGEHVEVVQSFKDQALTTCAACGGSLRKVFSPIGIAFKGSGFYRNDSRATSNGSRRERSSDRETSGEGTHGGDAGDKASTSTSESGASTSESASSGSDTSGAGSSGSGSGTTTGANAAAS
ncbi:MAG TPA: FmdB family zinc ribbon protein [Acidimicrobiales bacterium]|nr:FmdB family zinc ribbon protein [Acidimicrobiales bacterium]